MFDYFVHKFKRYTTLDAPATECEVYYLHMGLLQLPVILVCYAQLVVQTLYYRILRFHRAIEILPQILHVVVKLLALDPPQNESPLLVDFRGVQSRKRFFAF